MEIGQTKILVTGGGGYLGTSLLPRLLKEGYQVRVLDFFFFGPSLLKPHPRLEIMEGDIRDSSILEKAVSGCTHLCHLACISNDPSFELNPRMGKSINFDAFSPLVKISKEKGIKKFIYTSSSSVYGISDAAEVRENHPLNPLTDYSLYKAQCEPILLKEKSTTFHPVILRPAALCGVSPRQRFDLVVNILTLQALAQGEILVHGGKQRRCFLHIEDMVDILLLLLRSPEEKISGKIYNVGWENYSVLETAKIIQECLPSHPQIRLVPIQDARSYHICSKRIEEDLGYFPKRSIHNAIEDLENAWKEGRFPMALSNTSYYNVKHLQEHDLFSGASAKNEGHNPASILPLT